MMNRFGKHPVGAKPGRYGFGRMEIRMVSTENLGASGLRAPRLWLGAMMFGNPTSEEEARRIVDAASEAGVKAIDTSDNYAGGESEQIVGRILAKGRQDWIVATKVANPMGPEPNDRGLSRR